MSDDINSALGLKSSPPDSRDQKGEESSNEFIQRVRAGTCYTTLRDLINFFSVVSSIGVVIAALVCVVKGANDPNGLLPLLFGIGGGVFGLFIVIASRQASLLLIDIADTLIEQNRKKCRGDGPSA